MKYLLLIGLAFLFTYQYREIGPDEEKSDYKTVNDKFYFIERCSTYPFRHQIDSIERTIGFSIDYSENWSPDVDAEMSELVKYITTVTLLMEYGNKLFTTANFHAFKDGREVYSKSVDLEKAAKEMTWNPISH